MHNLFCLILYVIGSLSVIVRTVTAHADGFVVFAQVLVRILYAHMLRRKGASSGKVSMQTKRNVVLGFLSALHSDELSIFVDYILKVPLILVFSCIINCQFWVGCFVYFFSFFSPC